jgi:hypothetical protein
LRVVARCKLGDWFLLTLVKKNLDDRQFTSWIREVADRINDTSKKERIRRQEDRNGHRSHALPHWRRADQGIRERKCLTLESNKK